jgi:hypothetical protein
MLASPDSRATYCYLLLQQVFNAFRYSASALSRNSSALLWTASSIAIFDSVTSPIASWTKQNACSSAQIAASSASCSESSEGSGSVCVWVPESSLPGTSVLESLLSSSSNLAICFGFVGGRLLAQVSRHSRAARRDVVGQARWLTHRLTYGRLHAQSLAIALMLTLGIDWFRLRTNFLSTQS